MITLTTTVRGLSVHRGYLLLSACLVALCVMARLHMWLRAMREKKAKGSLDSVPGPPIARWTRFWIASVLSTGRSHEVWTGVNKKYGPVARIGPNHILTDDPAITRRVLAARSGYERGAFFDSLRMDPEIANIISERDSKKHSLIRSKVAPTVSSFFLSAPEERGGVLGVNASGENGERCD
jgi:hypothetical protein